MSRLLRLLFRIVGLAVVALALVLIGFRVAAALRETEEGRPDASRIVATPLGEVAVTIAGPDEGPPILLVHGTAGWSGFWRNVADHLAGRGWRVIAVDLPPFGYSERDAQGRYDRASQAERLAAVLRSAAGGPAVVVGHSFGAGPTLELALRSPDGVRSLVLVDAAVGELDPEPGRGLAERALGMGWVAEPVTAATMTNPLATEMLLRSMLAREDAAAAWVETIREPMRRQGTTAGYGAWLPALFATDDGAISRRSDALRAIARPVSIIWGEADTVTPIAQGERLARLMRARAFRRLPGIGHIPHIEDESGFLAALDAVLEPERSEGAR